VRVLSAPAGHRRKDHNRVAVANDCVEPVEHTDILVVEIDVDVAVELSVCREQLVGGGGMGVGEVTQDVADVLAGSRHFALATDRRAQNRGNLDRRHKLAADYPAAAQNAS
jgi:hypothetical protein